MSPSSGRSSRTSAPVTAIDTLLALPACSVATSRCFPQGGKERRICVLTGSKRTQDVMSHACRASCHTLAVPRPCLKRPSARSLGTHDTQTSMWHGSSCLAHHPSIMRIWNRIAHARVHGQRRGFRVQGLGFGDLLCPHALRPQKCT